MRLDISGRIHFKAQGGLRDKLFAYEAICWDITNLPGQESRLTVADYFKIPPVKLIQILNLLIQKEPLEIDIRIFTIFTMHANYPLPIRFSIKPDNKPEFSDEKPKTFVFHPAARSSKGIIHWRTIFSDRWTNLEGVFRLRFDLPFESRLDPSSNVRKTIDIYPVSSLNHFTRSTQNISRILLRFLEATKRSKV